ncbi:hypothetical protein [Streptomyces sp. LN245]|uniref:hypothetical protein n=1 Tax=Streptomyces sp. LN245 TaxID=3112975 RepID=UPI00371EB823
MSQQADPAHRDHDQALALTLALLLLTGSVLLMSCWIGPITPFAAVAVLVVTAYTAPGLTRRLALRRALRQLLRALPGARLARADLKTAGSENVTPFELLGRIGGLGLLFRITLTGVR